MHDAAVRFEVTVGAVALDAALPHRDRVVGLVLIGTAGFGRPVASLLPP